MPYPWDDEAAAQAGQQPTSPYAYPRDPRSVLRQLGLPEDLWEQAAPPPIDYYANQQAQAQAPAEPGLLSRGWDALTNAVGFATAPLHWAQHYTVEPVYRKLVETLAPSEQMLPGEEIGAYIKRRQLPVSEGGGYKSILTGEQEPGLTERAGQAGLPSWGQAGMREVLSQAAQMGSDPTLLAMGPIAGASEAALANAGRAAKIAGQLGPGVEEFAPELATWGKNATGALAEALNSPIRRYVMPYVHRGYQAGMALGGVEATKDLAEAVAKGDWNRAAEAAVNAGMSIGGLAYPEYLKLKEQAAVGNAYAQGHTPEQEAVALGDQAGPQEPQPTTPQQPVPESTPQPQPQPPPPEPPASQPLSDLVAGRDEELKLARDAAWEKITSLPGFPGHDPSMLTRTHWAEKAAPELYSQWLDASRAVRQHAAGLAEPTEPAVPDLVAETLVDGAGAKFYRVTTTGGDFVTNVFGRVADSPEAAVAEAKRRLQMTQRPPADTSGLHPMSHELSPAYQVGPGKREVGPGFYSQLQTVVDDPRTQARQSGEQWLHYLSDPNRGVKADEMKWTGLDDYLAERKGQPVTKQEIQQHLAENEVKVEEVTKGGGLTEQERSRLGDLDLRVRRLGAGNPVVPAEPLSPAEQEEYNRLIDAESFANTTGRATKFSSYTTPGGDNYRELLLTLPEKRAQTYREAQAAYIKARDAGADQVELQRLANDVAAASDPTTGLGRPDTAFRAGHFDEPNVLAHIRFNDRVDSEGKRVLFVEEVQSDWAQKGRKEGFRDDPQRIADLQNQYRQITDVLAKTKDPQEQIRLSGDLVNIEAAIREAKSLGHSKAPFVTDTSKWTELAMKRVLKYAADNGYDKVAWTTGEQQAERYDLSKQISRVEFLDNNSLGISEADLQDNPYGSSRGTLVAYDHAGHKVIDEYIDDPSKLADYIGKDPADKLLAAKPERTRSSGLGFRRRSISGLDLKVGGEGMRGFYDQILPQTVNKLGKKFGAKVGKTEIDLTHGARMYPEQAAKAKAAGDTATVHSLDIPQSMRETVKREGFPLFQAEKPTGEAAPTPAPTPSAMRDLLLRLYPDNSYIKENSDGTYVVDLPGGRTVLFRPAADHIDVSTSRVAETHGEEAVASTRVVGATWPLPHSAIVHVLSDIPNQVKVAVHEHWHVMRHLGNLSDTELAALEHAYPSVEGGKTSEERQADAFADWLTRQQPKTGMSSLFERVLDGLRAVRNFIRRPPEQPPLTPEQKAEAVFQRAHETGLAEEAPSEPQAAAATAPTSMTTGGRAPGPAAGTQATAAAPAVQGRAVARPPEQAEASTLPPTLTRKIGERYAGAPDTVKSDADIHALASHLTSMAQSGARGRYWYEEAAQRIHQLTQGNPADEEKLLQLIAVYSPRAPVEMNWVDALQAWDVYKNLGKDEGLRRLNAGRKVLRAGMTGGADRKAEAILFHDKPWSGLKTNSFYGNLGSLLFPERDQGVTVDRHIFKALGYGRDTGTDVQYRWAEDLFKHVADQMGEGWTPKQVQAAVWTTQRAKRPARGAPTFTEAADKYRGAIGVEAVPHQNSQHPLSALAGADYATRRRYTDEIQKALVNDQGVDELAQAHGLLRDESIPGPGYYEGEYNPGFHILTQLVPQQGYRVGSPANLKSISKAGFDNAIRYARALGSLLRQDSVGVIRPFPSRKVTTNTGFFAELGRVPTPEEMTTVVNAIPEQYRSKLMYDYSPEGLLVHNLTQRSWWKVKEYGPRIDNKTFDKIVHDAITRLDPESSGMDTITVSPFQSVSELAYPVREKGKAWNADESEAGIAATAEPSVVQGAYDRVRSRVEAVNTRWQSALAGEAGATAAPAEATRGAAAPVAAPAPGAGGGAAAPEEELGQAARAAVGPLPGQPPASAPTGAAAAPAPPPLSTGRATGNPPRVEENLKALHDAVDEQRRLGIPASAPPLDRDTRQLWTALDPEVKHVIATRTDDEWFKLLKKRDRNLSATETQALDAVTRGRKDAKDTALIDYMAAKGSPEEGEAFHVYSRALADFLAFDRGYLNDGTGLGRALAARNRIMAAASLPPDRALLRQIMKEFKGISDADADKLVSMWETGDPQFANAIRAQMAGNWGKFWTLYRANLIGIPSEFAKGFGDTVSGFLGVADRAGAAASDYALSKLFGTKARERYLAEAPAEIQGALKAIPSALSTYARQRLIEVYRSAWTGEPLKAIVPGAKLSHQISPYKGRIWRLLATSLDNMRILSDAFEQIHSGGILRAHATRLAIQHTGESFTPKMIAEAQRLQADIIDHPERYPDTVNAIRSEALRRVFRDPNKLVDDMQQFASKHQWLHGIVPFMRTTANITRSALRHSPTGLVGMLINKNHEINVAIRDYKEGKITQGEVADVIAPRVTGTLITAAVIGLAQSGLITGQGPTDPNQRRALLATGWQPYSMVFTGKDGRKTWLPYNRFEPISQVVGTAADIYELRNAKDAQDASTQLVATITHNLIDRSFLRGMMDFGNTLSDPQGHLSSWVSNIAGAITPATVDKLAFAIDPYYRDTRPEDRGFLGLPEKVGKTLLSQVPGESSQLPPRYTPTGEPSMRPGEGLTGAVERFLLPTIPTTEHPGTQLEALIGRVGGAGSPQTAVTVQGVSVPLQREEQDLFVTADQKAATELRRTINSPAFSRLPDTEDEGGSQSKQAAIREVFSKYRADARARLLRSSSFRSRARDVIEQFRTAHKETSA